jgi:ferredoxin-NADP reductase
MGASVNPLPPQLCITSPVRSLVKEKREVAKGTLLVVFDLQGQQVDFTPGQYFWVELLDPPYQDEKGPRRHISVVTSPTEGNVLGLCTRLRDTAFKRSLAELEVGDEVEVEEPKGTFLLPEDTSKEYVFIAGGIGITVFRCMLRYIADEGLPHKVTLVYSSRDRESTAFLDELQELERTLPNFRLVLTMTDDPGWEGDTRMLDAAVLGEYLGELEGYTFMIAGPPPMVESVAGALRDAGLPEERVLADSFSGY